MKTLIIKYLPSGDNSNTKKLYDHILTLVDANNVDEIDLIKDEIPYFKEESITAYYLRNFMGKELNASQKLAIQPFDTIVKRVLSADLLIFAFPMHNFSLPGIVKMFFDSFMFKGEFFNIEDQEKKQIVNDKKVLVLYTHGGNYPEGTEFGKYDFVKSLLTQEFSFMGMKDYHFISYSSGDSVKKEENLAEAKTKIEKIFEK